MIQLSRTFNVTTFDAEATVAIGRKRPEFLAVARLARDLDRPIGAGDVLRELLGPRPEVLGWQVIERSVALGLLERQGHRGPARLSDDGRKALEHSQVLTPQEGLWRFYIAADPLLPSPILHVQVLEPAPIKQERQQLEGRQHRRDSSAQAVPEILSDCVGGEPSRSLVTGALMKLITNPVRGQAGRGTSLRLELSWSPGAAPRLRVSGRLFEDTKSKSSGTIDTFVDVPPLLAASDYAMVWRVLVAHATKIGHEILERWRRVAGRQVCPLDFERVPEGGRMSFRHQLQIPEWNGGQLGTFEPTTLDVELVAASESDAQAWLEWLQWRTLGDYVTDLELRRHAQTLLHEFPFHRPRPLSPAQMLSVARNRRPPEERDWYLMAPADLGLWSADR